MDSRVLDVAIALVLVFALTSLMVSALQELYSSASGLRGKVLRQALESFVGDDPRFAQALLDHPLMVSLSPQPLAQRAQRRPSYANADTVVAALLAHLVDTHCGGVRPASPQLLLDALRNGASDALSGPSAQALAGAEPTPPHPRFLRGLSALAMGAEHDWPTFESRVAAWYDSVGERSTGWFKRKTQAGVFFFGMAVAAAANLNPIVIASRVWTDGPLREAVVQAAGEASRAYAAAGAASAPAGAVLPGESSVSGDPRFQAACTVPGGGPVNPSFAQTCSTLEDLGRLRVMGLPMGWSDAAKPRFFSEGGPPNWADLLLIMPLGWLVMGLACTLGAPFWFDALARLVRLRGSGGQTGATAAGNAPAAPPIGGLGMLRAAPAAAAPAAATAGEPAHDDRCEIGDHDATDDSDLPAARGGVAPRRA